MIHEIAIDGYHWYILKSGAKCDKIISVIFFVYTFHKFACSIDCICV